MKDDRVYLQHIRDALDDIATYTSVGRGAFLADRMRQDATLRKLEVIGQAVKNLSEDMKSRQPHIPWKQIAGQVTGFAHDEGLFSASWKRTVGRLRELVDQFSACSEARAYVRTLKAAGVDHVKG